MPMKIREIDGHSPITRIYGDGHYEPREEVIDCECGEQIWFRMDYYEEPPDWEQDWLDHIAGIEFETNPSPIYQGVKPGYLETYMELRQALHWFERIDCSIPGWRKGGLF